ncbi:MAG TPA: fumarylacetoacetate hydrolase family protein [Hanamia sp.]|nr:fumarylacetoacetate hydrolase family protein [Hanamia sp.]
MKLYKTEKGIVIENREIYYLIPDQDWDLYVNDDQLFPKLQNTIIGLESDSAFKTLIQTSLQAPIKSQEIWACGVTYLRSKIGREEESKDAGSSDFYARVYEADRPEIFFKATAYRTVGSGDKVNVRKDSTWNVPEPELTLMVTSSGKIIGYTIGNDMSSRSIEGENPLYLPQAKTYDASAAVGPCIYITDEVLPPSTNIYMQILRDKKIVFEGGITIDHMKRKLEDLVSYLFRENSFPHGCLVMTGTGIVPPANFTLQKNDIIRINIEPIGTLVNTVN